MTIDPNWILSTMAQSTAALVGIVGALIVARISNIAAQNNLTRQLMQEFKVEEAILKRAIDSLNSEINPVLYSRFRNWNLEKMVSAKGELSLEEIDYPKYMKDEDFKDLVTKYNDEIKVALDFMKRHFADDNDIPENYKDLVVEYGIKIDHGYIWDECRKLINKENIQKRNLNNSFLRSFSMHEPLPMPVIESPIAKQRFEDNVQKRSDLENRRLILIAQNKMREFSLIDETVHKSLKRGVWVLVSFAFCGMIYPVLIMLGLEELHALGWRISAVATFLIGFISFVTYLIKNIDAIGLVKKKQSDS